MIAIMTSRYFIPAVLVFATFTLDLQADDNKYAGIEPLVTQAIKAGQTPGAVVVVANRDQILYQRAFGDRQVEPNREPMTLDTVFDLASITKPVATATSVMKLIDAGKIDVDAPVAQYLPEFAQHGKQEIRVSDLLLHIGGLIPDNALKDYQDGLAQSWQRICELKPISERTTKFAYTDVGFIVLGKLVEQVSGLRAGRICARRNLCSSGHA